MLRLALGADQARVAADAGVSTTTLSNIETGRAVAREETLLLVAKAMGVPRAALEDDAACVAAVAQLVGVASPVGESKSVPREVAELLAQVPPEKRAGVVLMLRGMVATLSAAPPGGAPALGYSDTRTQGYSEDRTQGWTAGQRPSPGRPGSGEGRGDGRK